MPQFSLLVSIPPHAPDQLRLLAAALDEVDARATARPISWHVTTAGLCNRADEKAADLRSRLASRIESHGDAIVAMGLTGASHRFLTGDEISSELEWSIGNLWMTGLADSGPAEPVLMIPFDADPFRAEPRAAYESCTCPVLIPAQRGADEWLVRPISTGSSPGGACPRVLLDDEIVEPDKQALRSIRRRLRRASGDGSSTVVVQTIARSDRDGVLAGLLDVADAMRESGWEQVALGPELIGHTVQPRPGSRGVPLVSPRQSEAAQHIRSRRRSQINTRRVLETLSTLHCGFERETPTPSGGEREFIATMMGWSTIAGTRTSAAFDGGRFVDFVPVATSRPRRIAQNDASAHLLRVGGDEAARDTVQSCFSFESDVSRGLRVETRLDVAPGFALATTAEYSYVGDTDAIVFSLSVAPDSSSQEMIVPDASATIDLLAWQVTKPEALSLRVAGPGGSAFEVSPADLDRLDSVVGSAVEIRVAKQAMTIVYLSPEAMPVARALPIVRQEGERGRLRLVFGGRVPIGELAGAGLGRVEWNAYRTTAILVPGGMDESPVPAALSRRLSAAIRDELRATGRLPG